jgi:hypothetical protein
MKKILPILSIFLIAGCSDIITAAWKSSAPGATLHKMDQADKQQEFKNDLMLFSMIQDPQLKLAAFEALMDKYPGMIQLQGKLTENAFTTPIEYQEIELQTDTNKQKQGLQIDVFGPGIHMNQYGQPVTLKPDWGGVPGEQLRIKQNAYGPGVHMDQYGRSVREYSLP